MPLVADKRLIGNYGAAMVMSRLSGECLVRPVASDTDVGVDLYCETVVQRQAFLHFWIQVKSGNQCLVDAVGVRATCSFNVSHLEYWRRQPVPVFAALVPTAWPPAREPDIYFVDLTTQLMLRNFRKGQKHSRFRSDLRCPAGDRGAITRLLRELVPISTARLQVSRGVIAEIESVEPKYLRYTPYVPVGKFRDKITRQLRCTAAMSLFFLLGTDSEPIGDPKFYHDLAAIAKVFESDRHWENFAGRGLALHLDRQFEEAVRLYDVSIRYMERDPAFAGPNAAPQLAAIRAWRQSALENRILDRSGPTRSSGSPA